MVPQTPSPTSSQNFRPAPLYRKRKLQSDGNSDNDFSDDEGSPKSGSPSIDEDRRAHHNELERRRRDHIKDHFMALKSSIPLLEGEKSSRALILKRAVDYIKMLQGQVKEYKTELDDTKRRNENLVQQASVGLKPFLTQLQLQPSPPAIYSAPLPNPSPVMNTPTSSNNYVPSLIQPETLHSLASTSTNVSPVTSPALISAAPSVSTASNNSTSTSAVLSNLSSLLLQNPGLLAQLQQQQHHQPSPQTSFDSLTPPASVPTNSVHNSLYSMPELVDAQARLLVNSLALRERQFAAVAAAHF